MPKLINISVITNPHLNNEDIKNNLAKRNWSMVTEVEIESDHLQLNFEQKNELRTLIMEAVKKVTSPKEEDPHLQAKQIHHYLFSIYDSHFRFNSKGEMTFQEWLVSQYPNLGVLTKLILNNDVLGYSQWTIEMFARVEELTVEEWLEKVRQSWDCSSAR